MPESVTMHDRIDTDRATALAGLLDRDDVGGLVDGAPLPLCWHWLYFLERTRQRELGPEGHPLAGFPMPPEPGLRRMFAGGRIVTLAGGDGPGLRIGVHAVLHRTVVAQRRTKGRTGILHFATVRDVVSVGEHAVLTDERDIVYLSSRPSPARPAQPEQPDGAPPATQRRQTVGVDPVFLFRFSALTYNAHRIHYDRDYARDVEGHRGLVVHGPLQALLMAELAAALADPAAQDAISLDYRLVAPLYEHDGLHVLADPADAAPGDGEPGVRTQIVDDAGRVTARGTMHVNP